MQNELENVVEQFLMDFDLATPCFTRSVSTSARATTARKLLNCAMAEKPFIRNTAIALSVYLPLKWALEHPLTDENISEVCQSDLTISKLVNLQTILESDQNSKKLQLRERDYQIENTRKVVELVKEAVDRLQLFPSLGKQYYKTVMGINISPVYGADDITLNAVEKYYIPAITEMAYAYGREFDALFQNSLNSQYLSLSTELELLYHNTGALLEIYPKIVWRYHSIISQGMEDSELDGISEQTAHTVIEFVKLIRCAIEQVKYFPSKGELYHRILVMLTDEKYALCGYNQLVQELHIAKTHYYQFKKDAIRILSFLLWGITTREIISFLSTE